jgi:phosphoribosylamine--glycine ligase
VLDERTAATIFLVSGGYPGDIEKGKVIHFPSSVGEDQWLFYAGTKASGDGVVTNGGRVIAVTSLGQDIPSALSRSNVLAADIQFEGKFNRTDIGLDLMKYRTV